jgi:excinuclease ABC subunit B
MAEKPSAFSIDEFIGEIEKAEDERLGKRLPQERLKNKRALDNAARRAAEASGLGDGKLKPQPLRREDKQTGPEKPKSKRPSKNPALDDAEAAGLIVDTGKGKRSAATGMSLKAPKSKANAVIRPTNLDGFGETAQAGFGHVPSRQALSARDLSREAAKNPEVLAQLRGALDTAAAAKAKAKVPGSGSGR